MKRYKEILGLLIALFIFAMVLFRNPLFFGWNFSWYNDMSTQYNLFYQEWVRLLEEMINQKHLAVYSWNTFLGNDYLATKLFYCIGDPFIYIYLLIYKALNLSLNQFLAVETIICIVLSGVLFNIYLNRFGIKKVWLRISLSIGYALSGFVSMNGGSYMFHRFYAFMPLLFYFVEIYLEKKKVLGFILTVALLFLQNYECMFTTSLFMILYFIFSSKYKDKNKKIIDILKDSLYLIFAYFAGIMLCGIVLIPLLLYVKTNSRIGSMSVSGLFWQLKTLLAFFVSLIVPHFNWWSYVPPVMYYVNDHYAMVDIYSSCLVPLSLISLFKVKDKNKKKLFIVSLSIILVFLLIKPLNALVHGLSVASLRWSFILIFFNLLICAYIFENEEYQSSKKELFIILILFVIAYTFLFSFSDLDFKEYYQAILIIIISYLLLFVFDYLLIRKKAIIVTILCSACMFFYYTMMINTSLHETNNVPFNQEYFNYYVSLDDDLLYRYYFDSDIIRPFNNINLNSSIQVGYKGVTTYDSTYDQTTNDFNVMTSSNYDTMPWIVDITNPELWKMLGVKYFCANGNEYLLEEVESEYAYNLNDLNIYKITDYNSLGHTYSKFIKKSEADTSKIDWNNTLIIEDNDFDLVNDINESNKKQLNIIYYNSQYVYGMIENDTKSVMLFAVPYSGGWKIKDQDYKTLQTIKVQGGFLGVILNDNTSEVNMYYSTPGLKAGILVSLVGFAMTLACCIIDKKVSGYHV